MDADSMPIVFTPDNEPYVGRNLLFQFDKIISVTMERNASTAPRSYNQSLSDQQRMACQVVAQAISIMLSIRELIRQGYLFGAHVLVRSFVERVTILNYIYLYPEEIARWNRGWNLGDAPSLTKMLEDIQRKQNAKPFIRGRDITAHMNSLLHAKPASAPWNLVSIGQHRLGHAVSKILNRPELCDDLCAGMIPEVAILQSMMEAYFPQGS